MSEGGLPVPLLSNGDSRGGVVLKVPFCVKVTGVEVTPEAA